jgi:hypothetical protein
MGGKASPFAFSVKIPLVPIAVFSIRRGGLQVKGQKVSGNNDPNKSVMANCARRIGNRDYGDFLPIRPPGARNIEADGR